MRASSRGEEKRGKRGGERRSCEQTIDAFTTPLAANAENKLPDLGRAVGNTPKSRDTSHRRRCQRRGTATGAGSVKGAQGLLGSAGALQHPPALPCAFSRAVLAPETPRRCVGGGVLSRLPVAAAVADGEGRLQAVRVGRRGRAQWRAGFWPPQFSCVLWKDALASLVLVAASRMRGL